MTIDLHTMYVAMAVTCLIVAASLSIINAGKFRRDGTLLWALGWGFQGGFWALVGLPKTIPSFVSIVVANTCMTAGYSLLYSAIRQFRSRACSKGMLFFPPAVACVVCCLLLIHSDNQIYRIVFMSLLAMLQTGAISWTLFHDAPARERRSYWLTGSAFAVAWLIVLIRLVQVFAVPYDQAPLAAAAPFRNAAVAASFGVAILSSMGFMLMIKGRAELALRESETKLRALLDNSRDAIAVSKNGIRTFANPAYVSLFGYESADELVGKPILDIVAPESRDFMTEVMTKHATGEPFPTFYEETVLKRDGSPFLVESSVSPFTVNGEQFALAILRDITDRKKAEEEVSLLKHSIDVHYDGAYWMDTDNRFIYVNDAACRTLGYERRDLIGTSIYDVNPRTNPERMKDFWEGLRKGGSFVGESLQRRKDGTELPVEIVATHVRFGGREFACGFARDTSQRRKAEEQLRILKRSIDCAPDGAYRTDAEGRFLYMNDAGCKTLGYSSEELLEMRVSDINPRATAERWSQVWQDLKERGSFTVQSVHRRKDGSEFPVEVTSVYLTFGGQEFCHGFARDITERTRAEEALRLSESKFSQVFHGSASLFAITTVSEGRFIDVNESFLQTAGYPRDEVIGHTVFELNLWADPRQGNAIRTMLQEYGFVRNFESVFRRKSGEIGFALVSASAMDVGGTPCLLTETIDITDRKKAEDALLWKTTFLEALVHSSQDGILVLDAHMEKTLQNRRLVEMWHMPAEVAENQDHEQCLNFLMSCVKNPEEFYKKLMHLHDHPDDSVRGEFELNNGVSMEAFSYPVLGRDSTEPYGRIWVFRDITEIKRYWNMLENLSTTDGLTGIANRRRLDQFLENERRRSTRESSELSLLIVDIDHFKEFNDRYGHLAGDDCLRQVAVALEKSVRRAGDLVARYGGEEFACVLPGTGREGALRTARMIANDIARLDIPHEDSPVAGHVTVSIGVATVAEKGWGCADLIGRADDSLYAAKQQGRDRVTALPDDFGSGVGRQ